MIRLRLSLLRKELRPRAREAFHAGNGGGFVAFDRANALDLVALNGQHLRQRGIYEEALLAAYTGCKHNHLDFPWETLCSMFETADRQKLRQAGERLPGPGPFTLYRGVCGSPAQRREHGFSWTSSLSIACWFALRYDGADPAVMETSVVAKEVLAYLEREQEFIAIPKKSRRLELPPERIQEQAVVYRRQMDEEKKRRLEKLKRRRAEQNPESRD